MKRNEIINVLRDYKNQFAGVYGIIALGVFGSCARDEADEFSDVDVVIRLRKTELFMLAGIKNDLEDRLERPVDIVTYRDAMNQFLKKRIDREAVYV